MLNGVVHDLIVSTFGEDAMRHALFGPFFRFFGSLAEGCGIFVIAVLGLEQVPGGGGPTNPGPAPQIGPNSMVSWANFFYFMIACGGTAWAVKVVIELVGGITKAFYSSRIAATAGTDHQRAEDCERQRTLLEQDIKNSRDQLATGLLIIGDKDRQIDSYMRQLKAKDERIATMEARLDKLSDSLMDLGLNVSQNNRTMIETAARVATRSSDEVPVQQVQIVPGSAPVPVHEVGKDSAPVAESPPVA